MLEFIISTIMLLAIARIIFAIIAPPRPPERGTLANMYPEDWAALRRESEDGDQ